MRRSLRKVRFRLEEALENCDNVLEEINGVESALSLIKESGSVEDFVIHNDSHNDSRANRAISRLSYCASNFQI